MATDVTNQTNIINAPTRGGDRSPSTVSINSDRGGSVIDANNANRRDRIGNQNITSKNTYGSSSNSRNSKFNRYKIRTTVDEKGKTAELSNRSNKLPKPNIIRIEAIGHDARARFLGGYVNAMDSYRSNLQDKAGVVKPFYGFIDPTELKFTVEDSWQQDPDACGFGMLKKVASKAVSLGTSVAGAISGTLGAETRGIVNTSKDAVGAAYTLSTEGTFMGTDIYERVGINNKYSGTASLKKLSGVNLRLQLPIKCKWYMPEQGDLCRMSISRLMKLAYVREPSSQNDIINAFNGAVQSTTASAASAISGTLGKMANSSFVSKAMYEAGAASTTFNEVMGAHFTINPSPVRVSVGHILDIEPCVISNVSISSSKEQFVGPDGAHIPLFVTAEITIDFWMNPSPSTDFFQFMGDEMFSGTTFQ